MKSIQQAIFEMVRAGYTVNECGSGAYKAVKSWRGTKREYVLYGEPNNESPVRVAQTDKGQRLTDIVDYKDAQELPVTNNLPL